ncbi:MAG: radical SAM protein [Candidatus Lokiarchaeota archaeon]|nr:radical SAM protein [Candidatus Lokiarchaeota archaeon]
MSDVQNLFNRIKSGDTSWKDYTEFLNLESKYLKPFFNLAQNITKKNFGNIIKIYNPTKKFPAISITGSECALNCEHCNKKYLKGMKQILEEKDLEQFLLDLFNRNGIGALISGGSDLDGSVPLLGFLDTIKRVKKKTNLIINTHTGLLKEETARKLTEANVDIVSFDVTMDEEVIRNIYHLDVELDEYRRVFELLQKYNLSIVPHVCVGLYYGKLHKEIESIKFIKETLLNPSLIVVIALIPPKISKIKFETPKPEDIAKIIALIRFIFPNTEISLGCMRPRGKIKTEVEKYALKAGITRVEIPSKDTLKWLRKQNSEIQFKFFSACCAIPKKFEKFAESKKSDIKRYLNI